LLGRFQVFLKVDYLRDIMFIISRTLNWSCTHKAFMPSEIVSHEVMTWRKVSLLCGKRREELLLYLPKMIVPAMI
jgi:hypothetical protein